MISLTKKNPINIMIRILSIFSIVKFIVITIIYSACYNSPYNDFETDKSGLKYKVIKGSESKQFSTTGDIVEIKLIYKNSNDSVLFNSEELRKPFRMKIEKKSHTGGSFEDALQLLNTGSRALFIISADSFFTKTLGKKLPNEVKKGSNLIFDISLVKKLNETEIEEERKLMEESAKLLEEDLLNQFVEDNKIIEKPRLSGLYIIEKKEGTGRIVQTGDVLMVNYSGMFVNGNIFDLSFQRKEPFVFIIGQGNVIQGWEEGFMYMKAGGKARFIIPSHLAYGKEGYGSIIPPYSCLIFDVELIKIKNASVK